MSTDSIQGQLLEVTVVGCCKLKDSEWVSQHDPYVSLEYAHTKFRTRALTDGSKNPTFQEKFVFSLIEGISELNVEVWTSNALTFDEFMGNTRVQLHKVLSQGVDDSVWPLKWKDRFAGEVQLKLHFPNPIKLSPVFRPSNVPYLTTAAAHVPVSYPQPSTVPYPPTGANFTPPLHLSTLLPYPTLMRTPSPYLLPPRPSSAIYPSQQYPPAPGTQQPYPALPHANHFYPPGPYPGSYPSTY